MFNFCTSDLDLLLSEINSLKKLVTSRATFAFIEQLNAMLSCILLNLQNIKTVMFSNFHFVYG
jgi:hypothetical protein